MTVHNPEKSLDHYFSTRFFLPAWWAHGFEQTSVASSAELDPFSLSLKMRLSPAFSAVELNAVALILSGIQKQILLTSRETLSFNYIEFQRHFSSRSPSKSLHFARLLQNLSALRFLATDNPHEVLPQTVFAEEKWLKSGAADRFNIEFQLEDFGAEILLGYSNPHLNLLRQAQARFNPNTVMGDNGPVSVWKSPWMEFSGNDQLMLLRLEKAMQWQCSWLHFDGIFGIDLASLVQDLEFSSPKKTIGAAANPLRQALQATEKFGQRLCQHGLLKLQVEDEYLALDAGDRGGLMVAWQVPQEKAMALDNDVYRNACLEYVTSRKITPKLDHLVRFLGAGLRYDTLLSRARSLWQDLLTSSPESALMPLAAKSSAAPLTAAPLFLEWAIRQESGHHFPLDEELAATPAARLARLTGTDPPAQRLAAFIEIINENSEYRLIIEERSLSSFASAASLDDHGFSEYVKNYAKASEGSLMSGIKVSLPRSSTQKDTLEDVSVSQIEPSEKKPLSVEHMRRLAAKELLHLRGSDPESYKLLKKSYFDSLDASRRKFMLDLQGMMAPDLFESQLKQSLVKFMVENPGNWKSAKRSPTMHQTRIGGMIGHDLLQ